MKTFNDYINEKLILKKDKLNKLDYVDLGLKSGTLWAKYNVGVDESKLNKPEDWYGDYFMWGDTEPANKKECNSENYKYSDKSSFSKYGYDANDKTELDLEDDPANVVLGGEWHSPTQTQIEELCALTNEWVTDYNGVTGLNGRLFHGANDTELFFPAAGFRYNDLFHNQMSAGYIWSSSFYTDNPSYAYFLGFNNRETDHTSLIIRYRGSSVRGVLDK